MIQLVSILIMLNDNNAKGNENKKVLVILNVYVSLSSEIVSRVYYFLTFHMRQE